MQRGHEYWIKVNYSYMLTATDNPSDRRGRWRHAVRTRNVRCLKSKSRCFFESS